MPTPSHPLEGSDALLRRARVHADELAAAESEFRNTWPWRVEWRQEGEWAVFRAVITRPAPLELSVIMAEVIHELRASLDHLTIAVARLRDPKATRVPFPFHRNIDDFAKWQRKHGSQFEPDQLEAIRCNLFEPHWEPTDLLWSIAQFDDCTKHEVVPPAYAVMPVYGVVGDAEVEFYPSEQIQDGTRICRMRSEPGAKVVGTFDLELAYIRPRSRPMDRLLFRRSTLEAMLSRVGIVAGDVQRATTQWR